MLGPMTKELCADFDQCVASGGDVAALVGQWAQMLGVQRPAIWSRLRSGGSLPQYTEGDRSIAPRWNMVIPRNEPLPPVVRRDPCLRCGVRADVGCKHNATRSLSGTY